MAAALFVASAVLSLVFATRARARLGRWDAWTPKGVVEFRLRECELAVTYARWQLGVCAVLIAFAVFVWLAAEGEWDVLPPRFHYVYAASVVVAVLIVGVCAVRRVTAKQAERARLRALLREMRED